MITRETSLNDFCAKIDDFATSNYLLANSRIGEIFSCINNSRMLSETFRYFTDGFDFEGVMASVFQIVNDERVITLPQDDFTFLSLVFMMLSELNFKKLMLTDILDFMNQGKDYDIAFKMFCEKFIEPFKQITVNVCRTTIANTPNLNIGFEETVNVTTNVFENDSVIKEQSQTQIEEKPKTKLELPLRLNKLIELDKLSIVQSRATEEEKEDILYVLNMFLELIAEGDKEKIKLIYLVYYYAFKPFKKITTNLKDITDVLIEYGVL